MTDETAHDSATLSTTDVVDDVPGEPSPEAPYGYMTDPVTKERRPRRRPGRRPAAAAAPPPGRSPTVEELTQLGTLAEGSEDDTPPGTPPKRRRKKTSMKTESLPPFRAGTIAKGMNALYRKAGRLIRIWDYEIGSAVIAITRAEEDDDVTVGDAWEDLAKQNPRIRAALLKLMHGGAWTGLVTAHLPILLAIAMKPGIRERVPLLALADTLLTDEPDQDGQQMPSDLAQMMGGLTPDDMAQAMAFAQQMMPPMMNGRPASNMPRGPQAHPGHPADPEQ